MAEAIEARRLFVLHRAPTGNVAALQGLSLDVAEGEVLAVIGPSGSGKSTLFRCLAGLQRPSAGELHVLGRRLHDAPASALARYRAAEVGVVQQHYARSLSPDLDVVDVVAMRPRLLGWPARRARARALELLARVGVPARGTTAWLSGGQQQRVALCAALAARPRLLLADESTGELDERAGREVLDLIRELSREDGATVVLVTHDPAAEEVADRSVTVRDGRATATSSAGSREVLIDDGGVLRLEPDDLERAGLGGRASLEISSAGVVLRPRGGRPSRAAVEEERPPPRPGAAAARADQVRRVHHAGGSEVRAVDGVTLEVRAGIFHALVGPSGCGKTTLLHLLAGLERPTSGAVEVCGTGLRRLSREQLADLRRKWVAVVPQSAALLGFLTAEENVDLVVRARTGSGDRDAARSALARVGLAEVAHYRAERLSAGERQRVALARAVAARPRLLLADEPTANLDQRNAIAVARLLVGLTREDGVAVVCATHDASVMAQADVVLEMADGKLV